MITQYVKHEIDFIAHPAPSISTDDIKFIDNGTICVDAADVSGGVYDAVGNLCDASITHRFGGHMRISKFKPTQNIIDETVVFAGGGYILSHFGHFLLEGMSRLYPVLDSKYKNKKFVFVVGRKTKSLPRFVMEFLSGLGINSDNIILINKTTRFRGIYVPPQGAVITQYISPIMNNVFDKIARNMGNEKIKTFDKIYLSRGKMNDGRTFGEKSIEKIFAKNGYKIIYPETLPLSHQITLAHNCKYMAGTAGTALHLALFMRPRGTVIQIKRNTIPGDSAEIQNDICVARKLNFTYIAGSIERVPSTHFTSQPQILGITPELKQFFIDNKFKFTARDITTDTAAMVAYETQLHKYIKHQKYKKIVKPIARFISMFGITKYRRQRIREFITRILHAD